MEKVRVFVFVAAHFNIRKRYDLWLEQLLSIVNQSVPPTGIALSYSIDPLLLSTDLPNMGKITPERIEEDFAMYCTAYGIESRMSIYSEQQLRQFEHYKLIVDATTDPTNIFGCTGADWIFCADDDDLTHPNRIEIQTALLDEQIVLEGGLVFSNKSLDALADLPDKDKLWLRIHSIQGNTWSHSGHYVAFIMPFTVFQEFFIHNNQLISNGTCDLDFVKWLKQTKKIIQHNNPVYYYRINWATDGQGDRTAWNLEKKFNVVKENNF